MLRQHCLPRLFGSAHLCDQRIESKTIPGPGEGGASFTECVPFLPNRAGKIRQRDLSDFSKRVELKDPEALLNMGLVYGRGWYGLPVDQTKCIEFLRQSADLGCRKALHDLGYCHLYGQMGLEQNDGKALFYLKKAAEDGDMHARHRLGCVEDERGDDLAAMRHFRLPASGGYRASMEYLIDNFEDYITSFIIQ